MATAWEECDPDGPWIPNAIALTVVEAREPNPYTGRKVSNEYVGLLMVRAMRVAEVTIRMMRLA